jgi:arylsulfatase A-like enzyme
MHGRFAPGAARSRRASAPALLASSRRRREREGCAAVRSRIQAHGVRAPLPTAAILASLVILSCHEPTSVPAPAACPGCNVVVISMDTLRADHVGAYGYTRPTTPNVDRLAEDSLVFERAISQSAWTRPAHISMFTGLYPAEHGVVAMFGPGKMPPGAPTLAESLKAAGYATAAFTGGANMDAFFGYDRGFDVYRTLGKRMFDNLDATLQWLDRPRTGPFFLFFHGFDPHRPYVSEPVDRAALGLPPRPAAGWPKLCKDGTPPEDLAPYLGNYDASIHRGDRAVGKLLDALRDRGLAERTIVLFTSDHGEEFFEHGHCFHIYTLYREIVEVPLIVHIPGVPARRIATPVPASVAVAPTILDLVGAPRRGVVGPSLAATVAGTEQTLGPVVSETGSRWKPGREFGHVQALTRDSDKLVHWIDRERLEYYDLESDPAERIPRRDGDGLRTTSRLLREWALAHPPVHRRGSEAPTPRTLKRQLRKLGYVD